MTDNHGFNTPKEGELDWHIPLNENFEKLDTAVTIRDVEANLGSYTPKDKAKFLAIDTGRRYIADGTQWTELPYPTTSTSDNGSDTTTEYDIRTSDVGGLVNAMAEASTGNTILVDMDETISSTVALKNGVAVVGDDPMPTLTGDTTVMMDEAGPGLQDARVEGIEFDGNYAGGNQGYALRFHSDDPFSNVTVTGNVFRNHYYNGVDFKSKGSVTCDGLHVDDNEFYNIRHHSVFIGAAADSCVIQNSTIDNNYVEDDWPAGGNEGGYDWMSLTFGSDSSTTAYVDGCSINGNRVKGLGGSGWIAFEDDVRNSSMNDNYLTGSGHGPGLGCAQETKNCEFLRNEVENYVRGLLCMNLFWDTKPDRRPEDNYFADNVVRDCNAGIDARYSGTDGHGNTFENNTFDNASGLRDKGSTDLVVQGNSGL
jgi:hypothetical protein